jgi:hypothetical protein
MATSQERVQSIIQGLGRIVDAGIEIDPTSEAGETLEEIDGMVWALVDGLTEEGQIAK